MGTAQRGTTAQSTHAGYRVQASRLPCFAVCLLTGDLGHVLEKSVWVQFVREYKYDYHLRYTNEDD